MKTQTLIAALATAMVLGGCAQDPTRGATVAHGTVFMNGTVLGGNGLLFSKGEFYSNGTRVSKGASLAKGAAMNPNASRALALMAIASRPIAKQH